MDTGAVVEEPPGGDAAAVVVSEVSCCGRPDPDYHAGAQRMRLEGRQVDIPPANLHGRANGDFRTVRGRAEHPPYAPAKVGGV